jgi:hypothetical protein
MTREELLLECFGETDFAPGDVILEVRAGEDVLSHVDVYWRAVLGEDVRFGGCDRLRPRARDELIQLSAFARGQERRTPGRIARPSRRSA